MSHDGNQVVTWSECLWRPDGSHRNDMAGALEFAMKNAAARAFAQLRRQNGMADIRKQNDRIMAEFYKKLRPPQ